MRVWDYLRHAFLRRQTPNARDSLTGAQGKLSPADKKEAARSGGLLFLVHASARVAWPRVQKAWRREMAPETSGISPVLDPNAEKLSIVVGVSLWSMSRP